ncbi:putative trifunctional 2-polyprenylphenol hydroxylase/glutamate synthase subunit beta/ferritin domain-containing protein [bacterium BMS3Abin14]|nr:putative trifunctional 2-polyprenylphenol hydroxylase/glutamate synthase subunit beta/ferritin domain-containing protein [bacterium BMS3Abin14]
MSEKRESHVKALQIALETEKKGCRFYRIAAASSKDPAGKKVFEQLAKDEMEHMAIFAALFKSITNNEPWMTYDQAVARFGKIDQEKLIFPNGHVDAQDDFDDMKALQEALGFEKKAVEFYIEQAAGAEEDVARSFYQSIQAIEEGHVKIIQAELDSLQGTGFWLGYQEISLEH